METTNWKWIKSSTQGRKRYFDHIGIFFFSAGSSVSDSVHLNQSLLVATTDMSQQQTSQLIISASLIFSRNQHSVFPSQNIEISWYLPCVPIVDSIEMGFQNDSDGSTMRDYSLWPCAMKLWHWRGSEISESSVQNPRHLGWGNRALKKKFPISKINLYVDGQRAAVDREGMQAVVGPRLTTWNHTNSKWSQKWCQNATKMIPKWSQNDTKMIPKWYQNDTKMIPKWHQNDTKMIPKWYQNGP